MHRRDLRDAVRGLHPPFRILAPNGSLDLPHAEIHRIRADRILARGANHQTLHGDEYEKAHESVIWRFLHTTELLSDDEADAVIEMDVREDLGQALSRAVNAVVRVLDLPRPDAEHIGAALSKARGYRPLRESLHVTIGVCDTDVLPVEAGAFVAAFRKGTTTTDVQIVPLENVCIKGSVQGLFR